MIAKIRGEWIWLAVCKNKRPHRIEKPACDEQRNGAQTKLCVNGTNQKNNDPTHEQKTDI